MRGHLFNGRAWSRQRLFVYKDSTLQIIPALFLSALTVSVSRNENVERRLNLINCNSWPVLTGSLTYLPNSQKRSLPKTEREEGDDNYYCFVFRNKRELQVIKLWCFKKSFLLPFSFKETIYLEWLKQLIIFKFLYQFDIYIYIYMLCSKI